MPLELGEGVELPPEFLVPAQLIALQAPVSIRFPVQVFKSGPGVFIPVAFNPEKAPGFGTRAARGYRKNRANPIPRGEFVKDIEWPGFVVVEVGEEDTGGIFKAGGEPDGIRKPDKGVFVRFEPLGRPPVCGCLGGIRLKIGAPQRTWDFSGVVNIVYQQVEPVGSPGPKPQGGQQAIPVKGVVFPVALCGHPVVPDLGCQSPSPVIQAQVVFKEAIGAKAAPIAQKGTLLSLGVRIQKDGPPKGGPVTPRFWPFDHSDGAEVFQVECFQGRNPCAVGDRDFIVVHPEFVRAEWGPGPDPANRNPVRIQGAG